MKYFIPLLLCAACTSPSTTNTINTPDTLSVDLPYPNANTPLEHAVNMADTSDTYRIVFQPNSPYLMLDSAYIIIKELEY